MWDGLLTIALIWTLIAVPFRIAFEPLYFECEEGLEALQQCSLGFVVDLIVNFMFILDVCVVFSTGVWVVKKMPALLEAPNQSIFHQTKLQALLKSYTLKLSDKLTVNRTRLPSFVQRGVHNFQTYITEAANKRATAKVTDEDDDMDPSDNPYRCGLHLQGFRAVALLILNGGWMDAALQLTPRPLCPSIVKTRSPDWFY